MDELIKYLPFIIPVVLIELTLMIVSLIHIVKHKHYRFGNRIFWIIVCAIPNLLGPIVYLTVGREEE